MGGIGHGNKHHYSIEGLMKEAIERAKAAATTGAENTGKKSKGLEFMALRFNVVDKRRELQRQKKITPAESCLLQEIELGTIGARNKKKRIGSQAEFYIEDLSVNLGYKQCNKIWVLLKSLQKKGFILRSATRSRGLELIGLNPEIFGQILIDKEHLKEKQRHLKLVHNSESGVDNSQNQTHEPKSENTQIESEEHTNHVSKHTNRVCTDNQVCEITNENSSLDSSRLNLDTLRMQNEIGEIFTLENGKSESEIVAMNRKKRIEQEAFLRMSGLWS